MASMKAVRVTKFAPLEEQGGLKIADLEKPKAAKGEVLIQVKAASINPVDVKILPGEIPWAKPMPYTPGYDVAGLVCEVGEGVADFAVGDQVYSVNWALDVGQQMGQHDDNHVTEGKGPVAGAFAEFCAVPAAKVARIPSGVAFEQAAAVALVGSTAIQSVRIGLGCTLEDIVTGSSAEVKGKKLLILGGSGAVGCLAIQFAKMAGAHVITTCSARTKDFVLKSCPSIDQVVDYRSEKWEELLAGADLAAVVDTVGEKEGFAKSRAVVKKGGVFVSIAVLDAGVDPVAHKPDFSYASWYVLKNNVKDLEAIAAMLQSGSLNLTVESKFDFTEAGVNEAFKVQAAGASMGKNVIVM